MSYDLKITRPGGSAVSVKDYSHVKSFDDVWADPPYRGADITIPNRRGGTFGAKEYDAYTRSTPLVLLGSSQADYQDKLAALRALADSSAAAVTLSRILPRTGGDLTTSCASVCRVGDVGTKNGLLTGEAILEWTNLDGCWYGAQVTGVTPGTTTILGSKRTNKLTIVIPGAGTLTNVTTGAVLVMSAAATLTVQTKNTTGALSAITASGDPFGNWFNLAPGSNNITWSAGGSVTIAYYPAY